MPHPCTHTQTSEPESRDVIEDLRDETWERGVERLLSRRLRDQGLHEHELVADLEIDPRRWRTMLSAWGRFSTEDELAELAGALGVTVEELPL